MAIDWAIAVLSEFATGSPRKAVAAARETARMGDARSWEVHGPLLGEVMPPSRFPLATRVGGGGGRAVQAPADPEGAVEYGLATLLDGILGADAD
ncbi:hypothetical protein [Nocardia sp. R7R-8]|uniref:hypothetical protein n=1 Tax=Nocardia sp. R7R-8 TaxID=3459304 RepID=UPI00403D6CE7